MGVQGGNRMRKERIEWIDALRAWAIFAVVMGHLYTGSSVFNTVTEPVKMPMFYFLSGCVFSTDRSWKDFLKGIGLRIYIPYLIFSLLPLKALRLLLLRDIPGLLEYLGSFFSGRIFWFVPSFVLTQTFVFLLCRIFRGKAAPIAAAGAVCFAVGICTANVAWMDFWCINSALTAVLYMVFGLLMGRYGAALRVSSPKSIAVNGLVYLFGTLYALRFYPGCHMDIHLDIFYNIPLCLVLTVSGILLRMGIAQNIPWGKAARPWLILGQETFVVFLTHGTIQFVLSKLLHPILPLNGDLFWVSLFYTTLICVLGTALSRVVGRVFPELVGKRRRGKPLSTASG